MTVGEAIAILVQFDQSEELVINRDENGFFSIDEIVESNIEDEKYISINSNSLI